MKQSQLAFLIAILHLLVSFLVVDVVIDTMLFIISMLWFFYSIIAMTYEGKHESVKFRLEMAEKKQNFLIGEGILFRLDILIAMQSKDKKAHDQVLKRWVNRLEGKDKIKNGESKDDKSNN